MRPEKSVLETLYSDKEYSLSQVGKILCVSGSLVGKWLRYYGIQARPKSTSEKWDARKEEIIYLYETKELSQAQIADYFHVSLRMIQQIMYRLGIQSKSRGRRGNKHHAYKDGKSSVLYRTLVVKDKCNRCGSLEKLGVHHKNDDHYDNSLENLEILCNSCHMSHTKKAWWAAKKAGLPLPKSNGRVGWEKKDSV